MLFALYIAHAQKSYVITLSKILSYSVHKGSICSDSTFVYYIYKDLSCADQGHKVLSVNMGPTLCFVWRAQKLYIHIFARIAIVSLN